MAYDARQAWGRAGIYFIVCLIISWATGVLPRVLSEPIATASQLSGWRWWLITLMCLTVISVGYGVVWAKGTLTHGRPRQWSAVLVFGLLWGLSQGQLFVVIWTIVHRLVSHPFWTYVVAFLVISSFVGVWHSQYWDIYVSPEHNIAEWNGRKVLFVHTPNLLLTLAYLTWWENAGIFILLQTLALLISTIIMHFPPFWKTS
jgi:hypothetical protein